MSTGRRASARAKGDFVRDKTLINESLYECTRR